MWLVFLARMDLRRATLVRTAALAAITWSVLSSSHPPGASGRGLVVSVALAGAVLGWLVWTARPAADALTPEIYMTAVAGGVLAAAAPASAASAFVFVAAVAAGLRVELPRALLVGVVGALALTAADLAYASAGLGLLAYALGFAAATLGASNSRQSVVRAEQAELLLAQTQRSHEEQLRAARLEESTRLAREIHDVLAHSLAGLTIQLEATTSLLEQGAERGEVLARVRRAHELAREGLRETRLAVGTLRGNAAPAPAGIEALVAELRSSWEAPVRLKIEGDQARLVGETGHGVLRVVQEALTNVRKHATGAAVTVEVRAGESDGEEIVTVVEDHLGDTLPPNGARPASELATAGGGYGLRGMRERAEALGGTLTAGPVGDGWRVELRLPRAPSGVGAGSVGAGSVGAGSVGAGSVGTRGGGRRP